MSGGGQVVEYGFFDRPEFGLDLEHGAAALLDGGVGVLQAMTGQRADHAAALGDFAVLNIVHGAGQRCR